jgi:hypothetical protein
MAQLADQKKSLTDMTLDELQERILELRSIRRGRVADARERKRQPKPPSGKGKKAQTLDDLLRNATPEELLALLAQMENGDE